MSAYFDLSCHNWKGCFRNMEQYIQLQTNIHREMQSNQINDYYDGCVSCGLDQCTPTKNKILPTNLGDVQIVQIGEIIPEEWRYLKLSEAKQIKQMLNHLLNQWSVVGLETGKLVGNGYGNIFHEQRGQECSTIFIIKPIKR